MKKYIFSVLAIIAISFTACVKKADFYPKPITVKLQFVDSSSATIETFPDGNYFVKENLNDLYLAYHPAYGNRLIVRNYRGYVASPFTWGGSDSVTAYFKVVKIEKIKDTKEDDDE
jgi:hypothetical protein